LEGYHGKKSFMGTLAKERKSEHNNIMVKVSKEAPH
jgi:hypothetical protein